VTSAPPRRSGPRSSGSSDALNSGRPIEGAFVLAVLLPTLLFLAARSLIRFARWRLQRELWRRDVEPLERPRRRVVRLELAPPA
jgi:hypothetical protein